MSRVREKTDPVIPGNDVGKRTSERTCALGRQNLGSDKRTDCQFPARKKREGTTNTYKRGVGAKTLLLIGRVHPTVTRWAYGGTGEHGYWRKERATGTVFESQSVPPAASCLTMMLARNMTTRKDQQQDTLPNIGRTLGA